MSKKPRQNDPRKPVASTPNPDGAVSGAAKAGSGLKPVVPAATKQCTVATLPLATGKPASGPKPLVPDSAPKRDSTPNDSTAEASGTKTTDAPEPQTEGKVIQLLPAVTSTDTAKEPERAIPKTAPKPQASATVPPAKNAVASPAESGSVSEQDKGPVLTAEAVSLETVLEPLGGPVPQEADPSGIVDEVGAEVVDATPVEPGDVAATPSAEAAILATGMETVPAPIDMPEAEAGSPWVPQRIEEPAAAVEPGDAPSSRSGGAAYKALAFVLEVALLGAAGLWAIDSLPFAPVLSIAMVAIPLIVFWGVFMSPQAPLRFRWPVQPILAHLLFAAGTGLLFIAQQPVMGAAMGFLTLVSIVLTVVQRSTLLGSGIITPRPTKPAGRRAAR